MSVIVPFPRSRVGNCGTVHVMPHQAGGFEIGHESRSGSSWGHFQGPFATAIEAIAAAYRLNAKELGNSCDIAICPEALAGVPESGVGRTAGEF